MNVHSRSLLDVMWICLINSLLYLCLASLFPTLLVETIIQSCSPKLCKSTSLPYYFSFTSRLPLCSCPALTYWCVHREHRQPSEECPAALWPRRPYVNVLIVTSYRLSLFVSPLHCYLKSFVPRSGVRGWVNILDFSFFFFFLYWFSCLFNFFILLLSIFTFYDSTYSSSSSFSSESEEGQQTPFVCHSFVLCSCLVSFP